ncbi:MAG: hypothetical protein HW387_986 [Parachlamydiales bacterium]|nr:hypothetical protein [Parachlamydiales bacterium]
MINNEISKNSLTLPHILDFAQLDPKIQKNPENHWTWNLSSLSYQMGRFAFNNSPEVGLFFRYISLYYQIDTAIETGTFEGSTTRFFAMNFNEVHTIELSEHRFKQGKELLKDLTNVHHYFGNSQDVLKHILPTLKQKRLLCYLDAHWNDYWPLLDEIEEIGQTHKDHCIIVIDDVKVPGRKDVFYDSYRKQSGSDEYLECSYEFAKSKLDGAFSGYHYHYVVPQNPEMRAKLVVIPHKWKD